MNCSRLIVRSISWRTDHSWNFPVWSGSGFGVRVVWDQGAPRLIVVRTTFLPYRSWLSEPGSISWPFKSLVGPIVQAKRKASLGSNFGPKISGARQLTGNRTSHRGHPSFMRRSASTAPPFDKLSERQRVYLRHVFQHRTSDEIAHLEGVSARAVDKQLFFAKDLLGATSRFEAARIFAEFEAGVERFYPASIVPSRPEFWPLPLPVPTKRRALNTLSWRQVLAWGMIIAIGAPIALTVAAMVIISLSLLVGINPQ